MFTENNLNVKGSHEGQFHVSAVQKTDGIHELRQKVIKDEYVKGT
jgi:hypothetical protein